MKIFDYWAVTDGETETPDGYTWWLVGWGGSNRSEQAAEQEAEANLKDLRARISRDDFDRHMYYNGFAPVKERVIERFGNKEKPYAAITRNRYGALVLNAENVFFADVDLPVQTNVPAEIAVRDWIVNPVEPSRHKLNNDVMKLSALSARKKCGKMHLPNRSSSAQLSKKKHSTDLNNFMKNIRHCHFEFMKQQPVIG